MIFQKLNYSIIFQYQKLNDIHKIYNLISFQINYSNGIKIKLF